MDMIKDHSSMGRCDYRDRHKGRDIEPMIINEREDALIELMTPPPEGQNDG